MGRASSEILLEFLYNSLDPRSFRYPIHQSVNIYPLRYLLNLSDFVPGSVFSTFFSLGQTIETFRGKGIYQAAVDTAIQKVDLGGWVR